MKKPQPIICLPTDKNKEGALNLGISGIWHKGHSHPENDQYKNFHAYALSDEPIKEGDAFYDTESKTIHRALNATGIFKTRRKIIATSNPDILSDFLFHTNPTSAIIPLSLIEHYAKYTPKEVMVEYEKGLKHLETFIDGAKYQEYHKLKLTPSGEIAWSPVEEKVGFEKRFKDSKVFVLKEEHPRAEVKEESWNDILDIYNASEESIGLNLFSWLRKYYHSPKAK